MKPADLQPGHRIAHRVPGMNGSITVTDAWNDIADAAREGRPELGRVFADVEVSDASHVSSRWDPEHLPQGTGADAFTWLGLNPLRYRLAFLPDSDVEVEA